MKDKIVIILGPTGVGKTELAIKLALELKAEIISADSRQIYKYLDVGSGKPSNEVLKKVSYHFISQFSPDQVITASDFMNLAQEKFNQIKARGQKCLLVGGTGLWIKTFIYGLSELPSADLNLRVALNQRAEQKGDMDLYLELKKKDPETAKKLFPKDRIRIIRALEIIELTGKRPSEIYNQFSWQPRFEVLSLGLTRPREELYTQAEKNIEKWLEQGWVSEVEELLSQGFTLETPAMQAIGYSHLARHLQNEYTLERAIELIKRDTRRYIKRQLTWFRADSNIKWWDISRHKNQTLNNIREEIARFFEK